jgi:hypothetical protein
MKHKGHFGNNTKTIAGSSGKCRTTRLGGGAAHPQPDDADGGCNVDSESDNDSPGFCPSPRGLSHPHVTVASAKLLRRHE